MKGQVKLTDVWLKTLEASMKNELEQDSRKLKLTLSAMCSNTHFFDFALGYFTTNPEKIRSRHGYCTEYEKR
jgi:hypothetical protein